ncbi:concanavalin A-like lectin/glucanase domain-containing protein [Rhizophagus diaphanus]|nr:concanavalin A-like lectin/glucanase domain-containing protein [Rhizophagus diaphanus] [Rhizophagus sp. MUCL 43196]
MDSVTTKKLTPKRKKKITFSNTKIMGQTCQTFSSSVETSLEKDLRRLVNDERFHDITLKCSDGKIVFGYKPILATRSNIFNELIFTESKDNILSFNNINSNAMKVILEYLYTSKIRLENLNVDNFIEVYYAAIHFKLSFQSEMSDVVSSILKAGNEDTGKKLLSDFVNKFSLMENDMDDLVLSILVKSVATNKLTKNENDSLSLEGLRYLLMKTIDTKNSFATPEIEIWKYALMRAKREAMTYYQEIRPYLIPFARYINLNRMDPEEIRTHVEPYNIYSNVDIKDAYFSISSDRGLGFIRGAPIFKWKNDKPDLIISDHGFTVEANKFTQPKSILGDLIFKGRGVYEWNISVEKLCKTIYIGICNIYADLNKSDRDYHGWVLGSDGYVYHEKSHKWYDAKFKEGDKVTIHLDMKNRTCAFSINDNKKPLVSKWNIPSQVYPIVSLGHGSKLGIERVQI